MKKYLLNKYFLYALAILAVLFLLYNGNRLREQIANINGQNKVLQENIKSLESERATLQIQLNNSLQEIQKLNKEDMELKKQYQAVETKLKKTEDKYEKATHRISNFNGDSLRRYFTNL